MDVADLLQIPPGAGGHRLRRAQRLDVAQPAGSGDALMLAQLANTCAQRAQMVAVVCAHAHDAQRLLEEMALFAPHLRCALFPDWETLPYDNFSPHPDLISERLQTLWRIKNQETDVVLIPATTALYRLAPPAFLAGHTFSFALGQPLSGQTLKAQLTLAGYHHVSQVLSAGEYAVRGSLIDLFPMGSRVPYRLDLFDEQIDSIRSFDPDTQRSLEPVEVLQLLPGREFPMDEAARETFRHRWRGCLPGEPAKSRIYQDLTLGVATAGIEYYLPLFFEHTATVFDYLTEQAVVVLHGQLQEPLVRFWEDTVQRYRLLRDDDTRPALPPEQLFLTPEAFFTHTHDHAVLKIDHAAQATAAPLWANPRPRREEEEEGGGEGQSSPVDSSLCATLPPIAADRTCEEPLRAFKAFVAQGAKRVLVIAGSSGRRESLLDFFHASRIAVTTFESLQAFCRSDAKLGITTAALQGGFSYGAIAFVTEAELFATRPPVRKGRRAQEKVADLEALIKDLSELDVGEPVVHATYGIGRYRGLVYLDLGVRSDGGLAREGEQEFLHLEYADQAVLYVPVHSLHLISRYSGVSAQEAPLHRLGSDQWNRAKRKAAQQVRDSAAELLNIYARRAAQEGFAFRLPPEDYEAFVADFGFEETPDQKAAIEAVVQDMLSPRPMDRLVCGDVGFGKTEVALRAAFISAMNGRQVALLAPTTLLTEQHYQTLVDRFARWPVRIAEMSRFRTAREVAQAQKGIAEGTLDIVVGTHKLLSGNVHFKNLGLLIIDEEHRFGVRHKEAIKALRAHVDVLTLTATPIPRTLGMALEGLRELSIIATAPERRLAIKTFVRNEDAGVIREAILRELKRGGQCYFLHNDVATMPHRLARLQELLPEAQIAVAHGQMPERELERVMREFVAQRFNVLLCSTIIETGIDVPSANTIVISNADRFGLAQLHQLRGRVGRSHHQAYAYLLVADKECLPRQALQRLEAISGMEELGSGFYLAMHDLEIRGVGEVLGENQSGNMLEVGFELYNAMLAEAVRALKEGKEPDLMRPLYAGAEINLHTPALLPQDYCADVHLRLSFYKKLATSQSAAQLQSLQEELVDRFGKLPEPTQALLEVHRLRIFVQPYGVQKVDASAHAITLSFKPDAPLQPQDIVRLIQRHRNIRLAGNDRLRLEQTTTSARERAQAVRTVLKELQIVCVQPAPMTAAIA